MSFGGDTKGPATRNDFVNDIVNDARADAIFATLKAIVDDIVTCGMALKAVGPFYLVAMPGEVKDPTQGVNRKIPCRGLHTSLNHSRVSPKMGCLEFT